MKMFDARAANFLITNFNPYKYCRCNANTFNGLCGYYNISGTVDSNNKRKKTHVNLGSMVYVKINLTTFI